MIMMKTSFEHEPVRRVEDTQRPLPLSMKSYEGIFARLFYVGAYKRILKEGNNQNLWNIHILKFNILNALFL